jgi:hypothetical protein
MGLVSDMELARKLESIARRIRRNHEREQPEGIRKPWQNGKAKYGRLCNDNRKLYRSDVNAMYWYQRLPPATIAKHLGISQSSVAKLIERQPEG